MNKLLFVTILAVFANIASAVTGGVDVGFKSKLLEQGTVTGVNLINAGADIEVASFALGVNTYSTYERNAGASSGIFKRVDLSASYKFTSTLADLKFGALYKNASKSAAFNGVRDNVQPFVKLYGKIWDVTLLNDTKNRSNNVEGNFRLPVPVGVKGLAVVTAAGMGFNDPGTATIAALKNVKKYYNGAVGVAYKTSAGTFAVNGFVHRKNLTDNYGQVTGYDAGYSFRF